MRRHLWHTMTYEIGDGFYVDVAKDFKNPEEINFWLYHENCMIKMYMYGHFLGENVTDLKIQQIILSTVNEHINIYRDMFDYE